MRHLLLAVPFALAASTALGAGWESGMVEDEGLMMMAWVYGAEGGDPPAELRMMCTDQVSLRYGVNGALAEAVQGAPAGAAFTFDFGEDSVTLDMDFEGMDAMYAAYVDPDAPILGLLRSEDSVSVDAASGPWPVQEFTLQGSSKAISAVLKSCD
jgi:hypothetical protein